MDPYIVLLAGTGALILLVAWLPMALKEMPLSLPMFCVAFGFAAFRLSDGDTPHPLEYPAVTERLTELVVFVARPAAGWLSLLGMPVPWEERAAAAFFGIRGLGSFYYLAYALNQAPFG